MEKYFIRENAEALKEKLVKWRRDFHQNPELGLDCFRTASIVATELDRLNFTVRTGFARSGVIAGLGKGLPVVALRVDMDALPIDEETGLPFASRVKGAMHGCGHDGHTTIGLGVAHVMSKVLAGMPGRLVLIFQPGEEYPGGAAEMIKEGVLQEENPAMIMGLHIFPDLPFGKIGLRYGVMTASNVEFSIEMRGQGGHGAYPHKSVDPFPAAAALINAIQTIVSRNIPPLDALVVSLTEINGGAGYNVIPKVISLKGTVRSLSDAHKETALKRLQDILRGIETTFQVSASLEITDREPIMVCDDKITGLAEEALADYFGQDTIIRISQPSLGVDDFSFFARLVPATYLRLGSHDEEKGYIYPLHSTCFDFDEQLLVKGVEAASIILWRNLLLMG